MSLGCGGGDDCEHAFILDILKNGQDIADITRDKEIGDFVDDELFLHAVSRSLEVIAEASKHIRPETKHEYPAVDWDEMVQFRDEIEHQYWEFDLTRIWEILKGSNLDNLLVAIKDTSAKHCAQTAKNP